MAITHVREPVKASRGRADGKVVDAVEVRVEHAGRGAQALEGARPFGQRGEVLRQGLRHRRRGSCSLAGGA